ncbi:cupin domain-containing protein [uncultured Cohaesibacter sp.]|uniref:cupin domain-containing protein n=1 Tax=uncultured Cohaesibacter sp. TaxID=1002546 RepID=UPI0029C96814|nr:cupin domain-containing protein [uncultured Cohaesibacter sp.]
MNSKFDFSVFLCAESAPQFVNACLAWQFPDGENKVTNNKNEAGIFERGPENTAYAQYFVGQSYLNILSKEGVFIGNVTFEPGCRNNWHIHKADKGGGQILLCTSGGGWYQEAGKPAQALKAGDVVKIPAGVKHWHGAAKDSWFAHLAIEVPGENTSNEWLEPVSDEDYLALD